MTDYGIALFCCCTQAEQLLLADETGLDSQSVCEIMSYPGRCLLVLPRPKWFVRDGGLNGNVPVTAVRTFEAFEQPVLEEYKCKMWVHQFTRGVPEHLGASFDR